MAAASAIVPTPERLSFYPLVLMEDVRRGQPRVQVACLEEQAVEDGGSRLYTVDPLWAGLTDKDRAFCSLIFAVPGEGFQEIQGGYNGQRAWRLVMSQT